MNKNGQTPPAAKPTATGSLSAVHYDRALAAIRTMSQTQRVASMKSVGILTPKGNLASPYKGR